MAFSDPQTITINSQAVSLNKIKEVGMTTVYQSGDKLDTLELTHLPGKGRRTRSLAKFTRKKLVTNPIDSSQDFDTVTISFQIDRPEFGYSLTEVDQITTGLKTWLSSANVQKLFEDQH